MHIYTQHWTKFGEIIKRSKTESLLFSTSLLYNVGHTTIWVHTSVCDVQSLSRVQLFAPHGLQHARPPCPSPTPGIYPNSCPLSRWCHPAISSSVFPFCPCPQSFPTSGSFSSESALCIRWPKYQSFGFNISPSNEHPGQIYFRMDWLDLFAVQGTLKSLFQHHSSKASILQCLAFFIVQL